jgi:aspartate/methionine/tyrosine aminotransferase
VSVTPFSHRLPFHREPNALTRQLEALRASGTEILDLTHSNPTRAGIEYPEALLRPLADSRGLTYDPHPLGTRTAREAIARDHGRRGVDVDPAHIVLTASTSEAYTWLFKLLCNPGDCVLVPRPSYPLFEHLTQLEGVRAVPYELEYHTRWEIDFETLADAPPDTKVVLAVSPNNPTGSFLSASEVTRLSALCRDRGWALVVDEVFADYVLEGDRLYTDVAPLATECLTFTLSGFSKTLGLPQLKLGWIVVGGPAPLRARALDGLELIADSFLSVNTPVQIATPALLEAASAIRQSIATRVRANFETLRRTVRQFPASEMLRAEGGWSAVLRIPATRTEEQAVLDLLARAHVLVHPGYFFDFRSEAFLVISLLPSSTIFAEAVGRLLRVVTD